MLCTLAPLWAVAAGAAPFHATYLFELSGMPVGTVELTLDGRRYTYRSRHLFTRGAHRGQLETQATYEVEANGSLDGGETPESLWLWRRPLPGCVPLREELTERRGSGCVEGAPATGAWGTVLGSRFAASYDAGWLETLTLDEARFTRLSAPANLDAPPDLFGAGFPIHGERGALELDPPAPLGSPPPLREWDGPAARRLAARVHASFSDIEPAAVDFRPNDVARVGSCLAHARRFVDWAKHRGHDAAVVLGLLADEGRAYPHAWVRVALSGGTTLDLDPTGLDEVAPSSHLALGAFADQADPSLGRLYLQLAAGSRRVRRVGAE